MMLESGWWRYLLLLGLPQCHGSWAGWKYQCQFCYVLHALKANMEPANICIWNNRFFVSSWKCGFDSFSGALFFQVGHQLRPENRTTLPGWNFHSNSCRSTSFSSFSQWFLSVLGLRSFSPRFAWIPSQSVMYIPLCDGRPHFDPQFCCFKAPLFGVD